MTADFPRYIEQVDGGIRVAPETALDRLRLAVWLLFTLGIGWRASRGLGYALVLRADGIEVEHKGRKVCSTAWSQVKRVSTDRGLSIWGTVVLEDGEGNELCSFKLPCNQKWPDRLRLLSAFLPNNMAYRQRQVHDRPMPRTRYLVHGLLSLALGCALVATTWWSMGIPMDPDLPAFSVPRIARLAILGCFPLLAYGMLRMADFAMFNKRGSLSEWVERRPYEKGSIQLDLLRMKLGLPLSVETTYRYTGAARRYNFRSDRLASSVVAAVLAAIFYGLGAVCFFREGVSLRHIEAAGIGTFFLLLATYILVATRSYVRQMSQIEEGLDDTLVTGGALLVNGVPVNALTWPRMNWPQSDSRSGLNSVRCGVEINGRIRWYDLNSMEPVDDKQVDPT